MRMFGYGYPSEKESDLKKSIELRALEIGTTVDEVDVLIDFFKETLLHLDTDDFQKTHASIKLPVPLKLPHWKDMPGAAELNVDIQGVEGRITR